MSKPIIIDIDMIGGNCPFQAEGTINGHAFYFRARHETCSLSIAGPSGDVFGQDAWVAQAPCEDAGWIEDEKALDFIKEKAHLWAEEMLEG